MKVYLGSKNIVKINATKEVLEQYGFEVVGVDVDSKVSSQPKCDQETIEGAYNRAKALPKNSFRIGLEAGIEMLNGQMYLTNFGVLIDPNDNVYRAGGTRIVLPNEIAKLILEDNGFGYFINSLEDLAKLEVSASGANENICEFNKVEEIKIILAASETISLPEKAPFVHTSRISLSLSIF